MCYFINMKNSPGEKFREMFSGKEKTMALFGLGMLVGCLWVCLIFRLFVVGVLRVDRSDPSDGPYLFLELKKPVETVSSKQYVIFKVVNKNFISHE